MTGCRRPMWRRHAHFMTWRPCSTAPEGLIPDIFADVPARPRDYVIDLLAWREIARQAVGSDAAQDPKIAATTSACGNVFPAAHALPARPRASGIHAGRGRRHFSGRSV